jgi:peptidoglycan/LPS O-acetylase OafA/YrhL
VQGLRAVAVLAVVLYHAGAKGFGGGYVGVDCFFVISGFLITGLLMRDLERDGRVRFAAFYARRARRVLPAAAAVLLATAAAAAVWLSPLQARQVLRDCVASALFAGNYRFAAVGTNYLAGEQSPSPVQHYWSLGVEEQYYLVWPALIAVGGLLAVRAARRRPERLRLLLAVLLGLLTLASFKFGVTWTHTDPPWAFFSLPSRAWELGAGGLVAIAVPMLRAVPARISSGAGWLGLAALAWSITQYSSRTPFPGVAAVLPVAATALILAAGNPSGGPGLLLDRLPVRYIGDLSYAWYLWHWPVLVLLPVASGQPANAGIRLVAVCGSFGLAAVTLRWLENPIRFTRVLRPPRRALAVGAALVVATALGAASTTALIRTPTGHGAAITPIALKDPPRGTGSTPAAGRAGPTGPTSPTTGRSLGRQTVDQRLEAVLARTTGDKPVPRNLTPPLAAAAGDKATPFVDGCNLTWTATAQPPCRYTTGQRRVVILGDSHAAQWFPPLQELSTEHHWQLESFTKTTCPPLQLAVFSPYLGRPYSECADWRQNVLSRIATEKPDLVVLGVARHYSPDYGFSVYGPAWLAGLAATVRQLHADGISVLVMGPTPKPPADVPSCLSAHLDDAAPCDFSRSAATDPAGTAAEAAVVRTAGGDYIDVAPLLCTPRICPVIIGNLLVYRDDNHLTTSVTSWLLPALEPAVVAAMGAP